MFFALGAIEIIFFVIFAIILSGSTFFFRGRPENGWNWTIFAVGVIAFLAWEQHTASMPFVEFLTAVGAAVVSFWKFAIFYLALGFGYSVVEFFFEARASKARLADLWETYKKEKVATGSSMSFPTFASGQSFYRYSNYRLIDVNEVDGVIEPSVNKKVLVSLARDWVPFWPFFALSLVFGRLLTEVISLFVDYTARFSNRLVKSIFAGAFN